MRYLVERKTLPACQNVGIALIVPKICRDQPPAMYSKCYQFHLNRFTFGGVIAERLNTAKLPNRVNPIFSGSLASSGIIISMYIGLLFNYKYQLKCGNALWQDSSFHSWINV